MKKVRFATTNSCKIKFANNLLKNYDWECIPCETTLIEPQSATQREISRFKVEQAYEQIKKPIITMDSGIFINALNGFPGIYTSDIFKWLSNDEILRMMDGKKDRSAYIQQTLSFSDGNSIETFSSKSDGEIVMPADMEGGYAFDAFFKPSKHGKLMAKLTEDEKNVIWGDAWAELGKFLNTSY